MRRETLKGNENEELSELKTLYDELWSDAKTLFKDMNRSIAMYLYAGFMTILLSVFAALLAVTYLSALFSGISTPIVWFYSILETLSAVVTLAFGAKLLSWYLRLKTKYRKVIQMGENLRD